MTKEEELSNFLKGLENIGEGNCPCKECEKLREILRLAKKPYTS